MLKCYQSVQSIQDVVINVVKEKVRRNTLSLSVSAAHRVRLCARCLPWA